MNQIKIPETRFPIMDQVRHRWSARSFKPDQDLTQDQLHTLIESASWAASANNEQPWRFILAARGSENYQKVYDCLMEGNRPWCRNAAAFVVTLIHTKFEKTGKDNFNAMHDLGMANATLLLQATHMGIASHPMAGFDKAMLSEKFSLPEDIKPMVTIAIGFLDAPEKLEEPYHGREITPRNRKPLEELILSR